MNVQTMTKVSCPGCDQPIEVMGLEEGDAVTCPTCETGFVPGAEKRAATPWRKPAMVTITRAAEIKLHGDWLRSVGTGLMVFGMVGAVVAVVVGLAGAMGAHEQFSWLWPMVGISGFVWGLGLYAIGQVVGIRGELADIAGQLERVQRDS